MAIAARIILSNGMVIDLVGSVALNLHPGHSLFGDGQVSDFYRPRRLNVEMDSSDYQIYHRVEDAPEHNSKLRALPSGADRLPLERVDGEILPED